MGRSIGIPRNFKLGQVLGTTIGNVNKLPRQFNSIKSSTSHRGFARGSLQVKTALACMDSIT